LALHLGWFQLRLELFQQLHHLRVQLKVSEMIVHPEQKDASYLQ
jgi:hypothetical protein